MAAEYELDFRVGGRERFGGLTPDGTPYRYDALYYDIVPGHRIVYSYEMYAGDDRMSVSLTTVEIVPDQDGTKLTYTELYTFLDGIDKPEAREEGTAWMPDNLGKYLVSQASVEAAAPGPRASLKPLAPLEPRASRPRALQLLYVIRVSQMS